VGAAVFFQRRGGDSMNHPMVMAVVQQDGSFELVCGSLGKGAPPGDYDVLIEWKPINGRNRGSPRPGNDRLKGRYSNTKLPLLHATVEARDTQLAPFELASDAAVRGGTGKSERR